MATSSKQSPVSPVRTSGYTPQPIRNSVTCYNFCQCFHTPFFKGKSKNKNGSEPKPNYHIDADLGHAIYLPGKRESTRSSDSSGTEQFDAFSIGTGRHRCQRHLNRMTAKYLFIVLIPGVVYKEDMSMECIAFSPLEKESPPTIASGPVDPAPLYGHIHDIKPSQVPRPTAPHVPPRSNHPHPALLRRPPPSALQSTPVQRPAPQSSTTCSSAPPAPPRSSSLQPAALRTARTRPAALRWETPSTSRPATTARLATTANPTPARPRPPPRRGRRLRRRTRRRRW
jgi:hypothetical protein